MGAFGYTPPKYGIGQMIVGSVYVTLGAIIIGVPIGVLAATFLSRFCPRKLYKVFKPIVELLAGIPSVVYGFFGMVVIVAYSKRNFRGKWLQHIYGVHTSWNNDFTYNNRCCTSVDRRRT